MKRIYAKGLVGLALVWLLLFLIAEEVQKAVGAGAIQSLNIAITGGLSLALVVLYFRQTLILDAQRELLTQELNHEARRQHTETLKKRIRLWHGDPDREEPENLLENRKLSFPQTAGTRIESARAGGLYMAMDESFEVIPPKLQNDRYLEDFLENHASDVRETVDNIKSLQSQYKRLMDEYEVTGFSSLTFEGEDYQLYPSKKFNEWIFRQVVLVETGRYQDFEEMADKLPENMDNAAPYGNPDNAKLHIPVRDNESQVYVAESTMNDLDTVRENQEQIDQRVLDSVQQVLRGLPETRSYETAKKGAKTFVDASEHISRLEELLIEYEGRPIIQGDCEYLEEARIGN